MGTRSAGKYLKNCIVRVIQAGPANNGFCLVLRFLNHLELFYYSIFGSSVTGLAAHLSTLEFLESDLRMNGRTQKLCSWLAQLV